jgi:hypothetical protein
LFLLAAAVALAHHYYRRLRRQDSPADAMLTEFHEIRDRGELSEEEYKKIKTLLSQRLRKDLGTNNKTRTPLAPRKNHHPGP